VNFLLVQITEALRIARSLIDPAASLFVLVALHFASIQKHL